MTAIVDASQATGELDNTYLVFASHNGYMLGDHRTRGGKIFPYDVSARVPMLIRGPGIPGAECRQPRPRTRSGLLGRDERPGEVRRRQ